MYTPTSCGWKPDHETSYMSSGVSGLAISVVPEVTTEIFSISSLEMTGRIVTFAVMYMLADSPSPISVVTPSTGSVPIGFSSVSPPMYTTSVLVTKLPSAVLPCMSARSATTWVMLPDSISASGELATTYTRLTSLSPMKRTLFSPLVFVMVFHASEYVPEASRRYEYLIWSPAEVK